MHRDILVLKFWVLPRFFVVYPCSVSSMEHVFLNQPLKYEVVLCHLVVTEGYKGCILKNRFIFIDYIRSAVSLIWALCVRLSYF